MRIGITVYPAKPIWESGANQTALSLGELAHTFGHEVTFIHTGLHPWWDNYPLPSYATEYHYSSPSKKPFDLLLDVDGTLDGKTRKSLSSHTVLFLRTFLQFAEMDQSVYIETPYRPRSTDNLSEVWCWDILNPPETIPSIQGLFPCPIRRVPFFWSPTITEHFTKKESAFSFAPEPKWTIHIAEKNTNESSAVIPLVSIREAHRTGKNRGSILYAIHNMDSIKENRFLKENILGPIEVATLPVTPAPRQPFYEWTQSANHLFFSHSRFTPLRLSLLHLVWMGVPLFHNSPVLRDLHPMLQEGFYQGNEITEWTDALDRFMQNPTAWWIGVEERREVIRQRFGVQPAWEEIFTAVATTTATSLSPPAAAAVHILFTDMWPGFNPHTNFLLDTLRYFYPKTTFHGSTYNPATPTVAVATVTADLIIVGPYEQTWRTISKAAPMVFFSAENWPVPDGPFALYLTSSRQSNQSNHFRIPTWMTFIDWFTGRTSLPPQTTDNPIRLPLHFATHPHPIPYQERKEFCAFVVSNPSQPFRNETFEALHAYKPVSSGGALYNNIGGPLSLLYPGGGAGDLSKHEFFTRHRFTLSAENAQRSGYITEKVLHAKMAGAIPLYWGDSNTDDDFAPNSIVNLSHLSNPSDVVSIVKRLEEHPEFCERIASTPLLDLEKTEAAIELLRNMSNQIMGLLPFSLPSSPSLPSSLFNHIYVINLDRRKDRWESLLKAEPYLASTATRISAVDGKKLRLTPWLEELFEHNHFEWKKGVIGCNLSHMSVWSLITPSLPSLPSLPLVSPYTLILEDDVRFVPDWKEKWTTALPHIPSDADLLYLGGVLPPNQPALPHALTPVNPYWSRIKPNTFFSATPAPLFHFCAYSYVLTPSGAKKLMNHLLHSKEKYYTISDHMLGSPIVGLTKYILTPLITHCFQEVDPAYQTSQFNELQRTDTFDSDLWNNTDRFHPQEEKRAIPIYYMSQSQSQPHLYESTWLEELFGPLTWRPITTTADLPSTTAWYLVQRPYSSQWANYFAHLEEKGTRYRVLHLSDEFATDDITYYDSPCCDAVIRNYERQDLPQKPHIYTIPLGYHYKARTISSSLPFSQRKWEWSFHGTDWFNRRTELAPLCLVEPYDCRLQPSWNHPTATTESEYLQSLSQSKFCPILKGNHSETFRFYEALEAGVLPVTTITDRTLLDRVEKELGLSSLYPWTNPEKAIKETRGEEGDRIQQEIGSRWAEWKARIRALPPFLTAVPSS